MKAISLWQPWATLIAIGAKRFETRSWPAKYSGPLAIHASKRRVKVEELSPEIADAIHRAGLRLTELPLGCVVATCDLKATYQIGDTAGTPGLSMLPPAPPELFFGDYTAGRFAWLLQNIRPLRTPIPFTGKQRWFNVPDAQIEEARA